MRLNLWYATRKNKANKLPKSIRRCLIDQFNVLPEHLGALRCFEVKKRIDGKQVRNIQVFCPAMALERRLVLESPSDLERHPEFLLYEGQINEDGSIYLSDRIWPSRRSGDYDSDDAVPEKKLKTLWF